MHENELSHYGIVGMKWGVRRYQNKDGSLTDAGEMRYAKKKFKTELKEDKKTARRLTRDAAAVGKAYARVTKNLDKLERQFEDLDKEGALPQNLKTRYETTKEAKKILEKRYKEYESLVEKHHSKMSNKYGEEHVTDIRYKNKNGINIVDNGDTTGRRVAATLGLGFVLPLAGQLAFAGYHSSTVRSRIQYAKAIKDVKLNDFEKKYNEK